MKRFDYTNSKQDIFYKIIYPVFAKEFLLGSKYDDFKTTVETTFILNPQQWEHIKEHWDEKEEILK